MSKPRPFQISFETASHGGRIDLGELAAEDHASALGEAVRRFAGDCPEEVCDIVAADEEGRERRVEIDPYGHDYPLAVHAPDRYMRKLMREQAEHLDQPPISERPIDTPEWER